ncbi:MAG: hypothetical protein JEZ11_13935 [Desulfobacterales bacterium]|nr:hypothetical protein [Desulfobacterales bacterium]
MIKIIFHLTIGLVAFACLLAGAQASVLHKKNNLSISLPDGWVEIPKDVIDAWEKTRAEEIPKEFVPHVDCAFQLDNAENWFDCPYILVIIHDTGRISEKLLGKMEEVSLQENLDKQIQERLDKNKEGLSSIATNIQIGKIHFDKDSKITWQLMESNAAKWGPISGLSGSIPTEKGLIQVVGYSLKYDFPIYGPIFESSAMSVVPSHELIYKAKAANGIPAEDSESKSLGYGMVYTVIFGGIIFALSIRSKRKIK